MDELNKLLKDYQQAMQSDELQELAKQCKGALDNFDTTMRPYIPQIRQAMLELNKALIPVIEGLQQAQVDAQPLVELQEIVAVEENNIDPAKLRQVIRNALAYLSWAMPFVGDPWDKYLSALAMVLLAFCDISGDNDTSKDNHH